MSTELRHNRRRSRIAVLMGLTAVVVAACGGSGDGRDAQIQDTEPAVTTTTEPTPILMTTVVGNQIDIAGIAKTDTLLWFWAPW